MNPNYTFEKPIIINDQVFAGGVQLRKYINQTMRNRYQLNTPLTSEDTLFIKALIRFFYPNQLVDRIQTIVIDYYHYQNQLGYTRRQKVFYGVIQGQPNHRLKISRVIDHLVLKDALLFTSKRSGKTLRIYPIQGKTNYTKQDGTWEIVAEETIRDAQTKEEIGTLDPTSVHKIAKVFNGQDSPLQISGKIDVVPSLIFTSNQSGKTLNIIQTGKKQKDKNCLTSQGEWLITATGRVLDANTKEAIGTLDQDSRKKVASSLNPTRPIKVAGKMESLSESKRQRENVLRGIIRPQIQEYARQQKEKFPHRDFSDDHVDHVDPLFAEIVEDWMLNLGMTWENLQLSGKEGVPQLKSQVLARDFYHYHKQVAQLDYLSKEDNLKRVKPFQ